MADCGYALAGVQFATNAIDEGLRAARIAEQAGAAWIDLNCGCPIFGKLSVDGWPLL